LRKPDGTSINLASAGSDPNIEYIAGPTYKYYRIHTPILVPGNWQMLITGGSISAAPAINQMTALSSGEPYTVRVTAAANLTMRASLNRNDYQVSQPAQMTVTLSDNQPILGASVNVSVEAPSQAALAIRAGKWIEFNGDTIPDPAIAARIMSANLAAATSATIQLFDDGLHGDGAANDGVYGNQFTGFSQAGTYVFSFSASGTSTAGGTFTRQSQTFAYVAQNSGPTVTSITRANPNPTSAASVDFTVTFSESVKDVELTDFVLTTTGMLTGMEVKNVSGGPVNYTVNVNTGTGSGGLHLDLPTGATITNLSDIRLAGLPYTSGESYTINGSLNKITSSGVTLNPGGEITFELVISVADVNPGVSGAEVYISYNPTLMSPATRESALAAEPLSDFFGSSSININEILSGAQCPGGTNPCIHIATAGPAQTTKTGIAARLYFTRTTSDTACFSLLQTNLVDANGFQVDRQIGQELCDTGPNDPHADGMVQR
jgi:hypothetical protein